MSPKKCDKKGCCFKISFDWNTWCYKKKSVNFNGLPICELRDELLNGGKRLTPHLKMVIEDQLNNTN